MTHQATVTRRWGFLALVFSVGAMWWWACFGMPHDIALACWGTSFIFGTIWFVRSV